MSEDLRKLHAARAAIAVAVILMVTLATVTWQSQTWSWGPERLISLNTGDSRIVDLQTDPSGAALHMVWEDSRQGTQQVYYLRSLDGGASWESEIRLSNLTPHTAEPLPRVASNGRNVLVVFSNLTDTGEHLYYVISSDLGDHFSKTIQLTAEVGDQNYPAVAFTGNTAHVVWQGYFSGGERHIFYAKSGDGGFTWNEPVQLSDVEEQDRHPSVYAAQSKVYVVWGRDYQGQEAVFIRQSTDDGKTWKPEVQVSRYETPVFLVFPTVVSDGNQIHVLWNGPAIFYSRSDSAGSKWTRPYSLTNGSRQYIAPKLAISGQHLQVVSAAISVEGPSQRLTISSDVFYIESNDGGKEWTDPILLTNHPKRVLSLAPSIAVSGSATFVAWQDDREGSFGIFFRSQPDFALIWSFGRTLLNRLAIALVVASLVLIVAETFEKRRPHRRRLRSRKRRSR